MASDTHKHGSSDSTGPSLVDQPRLTDSYFNLTRQIILNNQDCEVTYAVFMRRPVTLAPKLAVDWLNQMIAERGSDVKIEQLHKEGAWVGQVSHYSTSLAKCPSWSIWKQYFCNG